MHEYMYVNSCLTKFVNTMEHELQNRERIAALEMTTAEGTGRLLAKSSP